MYADDEKKVIEALKALKVKPKADTAEDFVAWMGTFVAGKTTDTGDAKPVIVPSPVTVPIQIPRISVFTGENTKGELSFDLWKYEVKWLLMDKTYSPDITASAIKKSLRGEAGRVAMRLGPAASTADLMEKLENVYGTLELREGILAQFYSAKQQPEENVIKWGCRLEDILAKAIEKGLVDPSNRNEMLRNMFWTGLNQSLKDISGHKYDSIYDFDKLRTAVQIIESEHIRPVSMDRQPTNKAMVTVPQSEIQSLRDEVRSLAAELRDMRKSIPRNNNTAGNSFNSGSGYNTNQQNNPAPQCWKCSKYGHIARNCRVKTDRKNKDLNSQQSMGRDHP